MTMHDDGVERIVPERNWRRASILMIVLVVLATAGWEIYWRSEMYDPHPNKTYGLWAIQRRAASKAVNPLVIIGSSRILFDVNLDVWERITGERPIQLALEGTSPRIFLRDLADDSTFVGRVMVGVTPPLFFFSVGGLQAKAIDYYKKESPSEWIGQQIGMRLEQRFAFLESSNLPLFRILSNIPLRSREGVSPPHLDVHKLAVAEIDRNTRMWRRVEQDAAYRNLAREIWVRIIDRIASRADPEGPPFDPQPVLDAVKNDVDKIRQRGGDVVFVRCPSSDAWHDLERNATPREKFWDALLDHTQTGGVHFEDNEGLQGLELPEWSHLSAASAERFTEAIVPLVNEAFATRRPVRDKSLNGTDASVPEELP